MNYEDWFKQYTRTFICRMYTDGEGTVYSRTLLSGEWKGKASCLDNQFGVTVTRATHCVIAIAQEDDRVLSCKHNMYPMMMFVFKTTNNEVPLNLNDKQTLSNLLVNFPASGFSSDREIIHDFTKLEPGKYILVPLTPKPVVGKFWITVLSEHPTRSHYVSPSGVTNAKSDDDISYLWVQCH